MLVTHKNQTLKHLKEERDEHGEGALNQISETTNNKYTHKNGPLSPHL